jgi:hypothetical protein
MRVRPTGANVRGMSAPERARFSEPKMIALAVGAGAVLFLCVVALAETDDIWIGVLTLIALAAMAIAIIVDLRHVIAADAPRPAAPPASPERAIVLCSDALTATQVLDAVGPERQSIMVVAREGSGSHSYVQARRVEADTVAALRKAGVNAAGHVGDHNPAHAVDDALALFPAAEVVVVVPAAEVAVYHEHLDPLEVQRRTGVDVRVVEVVAS